MGFKMVGKRGSKYYDPPRGNIRYNLDTMTGMDKEKLINKIKESKGKANISVTGGTFSNEVQSLSQQLINQNFFVTETKDANQAIADAVNAKNQQSIMEESNEAAPG